MPQADEMVMAAIGGIQAEIAAMSEQHGKPYAMAVARIAFDAQFAEQLTRALVEHMGQCEKAEHLLVSLAHVLAVHAECEAALLGVGSPELTYAGIELAEKVKLSTSDAAPGVH